MVKPLLVYKPRTTSYSKGTCSMVDYVVLLLAYTTHTHGQIHRALAAWRNKPLNSGGQLGCASHLTDRTYGYVGHSYNSLEPWCVFFYSRGTNHTALWYRTAPGVYSLTNAGYARLTRILNS